jgi:hypothetical protein
MSLRRIFAIPNKTSAEWDELFGQFWREASKIGLKCFMDYFAGQQSEWQRLNHEALSIGEKL